jgi:nucleotide-binding universal stress UspA family protein
VAHDPARRILVATDDRRLPRAALDQALAVAGHDGEVVLAAIIVVPVTQPLEANLAESVARACEVLDAGDRLAREAPPDFDTRLVRARTFAKGVLQTLDAETFDAVVLEQSREQLRDGAASQAATVLEKAGPTVILVRPAEPDGTRGALRGRDLG